MKDYMARMGALYVWGALQEHLIITEDSNGQRSYALKEYIPDKPKDIKEFISILTDMLTDVKDWNDDAPAYIASKNQFLNDLRYFVKLFKIGKEEDYSLAYVTIIGDLDRFYK